MGFASRRVVLSLVGALGVAGFSPVVSADTLVTANVNATHQTMAGFGTNTAWWLDANPTGAVRSVYDTPAFYDLYYNQLGASALRIEMQYTVLTPNKSLEPTNAEMSTPVSLGSDTYANIAKFNFGALGMGHTGKLVQEGVQRLGSDFKLQASLWSPPHWMKGPELNVNNQPTVGWSPFFTATANSSGGSLIDTPQNLQQFGRYIAAYLKGYEQHYGKAIDSLSLQNELRFHEEYNSAVYTPALYKKAVQAVRTEINAHNNAHPSDLIQVDLIGPETIGMGGINNPWLAWKAFNYIDEVRHDGDPASALDGYALHGFNGGDATPANTNARRQAWATFRDGRSPQNSSGFNGAYWQGVGDQPELWVTEYSGHEPVWTDSGNSTYGAMGMAIDIYEAIVAGDANAYFYWQTRLKDTDPASSQNLTQGNDPDQPKFAAFRHFAKFIRPGDIRIDTSSADDDLFTTAFISDDGNTFTYLLINTDTNNHDVDLLLPAAFANADVAIVQSSNGQYSQTTGAFRNGADVQFQMPGSSILTLVASLISSVITGDYNNNGQVEQGDLDLVLQGWGSFSLPRGWINNLPVGQIDQAELDTVLQNWGSTNASDFQGTNLPEPASLALLGFAGLALHRRRA